MEYPLTKKIMEAIGLGDEAIGSYPEAERKNVRTNAVGALKNAINNAVEAGEQIALPNVELLYNLQKFAEICEEPTSLVKTRDMASKIVHQHIEAAKIEDPKGQEALFLTANDFLKEQLNIIKKEKQSFADNLKKEREGKKGGKNKRE